MTNRVSAAPLTRSIQITTKEVTDPDVAVSSDGRWLVFTALGHLFQLPVAGGATKQLTSGPYYDSGPAISPDGTKVAFISDRKVSSQGNVFVLDIASGQIRQVTDEAWVERPVWSPDGKSGIPLASRRRSCSSNRPTSSGPTWPTRIMRSAASSRPSKT